MNLAISDLLSGATRLHFIVGDPIAQVKSPSGVTQALREQGNMSIVLPAHVSPDKLGLWLQGITAMHNVDGILVTVPHKFAAFELCDSASPSAQFLRTANMMRRNARGLWYGDMSDGQGYVQAMRQKGCDPQGKRALLVGAGGAGSAIAYALVTSGVSSLAIHDPDVQRRDSLIARLASLNLCPVTVGSADPTGHDIAINATPIGMQAGDPYPIDPARITQAMFVGCVITAPAVPPLIEAARAKGCNSMTGADMFACVRDLIVEFLQGK